VTQAGSERNRERRAIARAVDLGWGTLKSELINRKNAALVTLQQAAT
jgi:hypothetical protein